nr:hypothetical protein [Streptosporangium sp. 'caverna']
MGRHGRRERGEKLPQIPARRGDDALFPIDHDASGFEQELPGPDGADGLAVLVRLVGIKLPVLLRTVVSVRSSLVIVITPIRR